MLLNKQAKVVLVLYPHVIPVVHRNDIYPFTGRSLASGVVYRLLIYI